MYIRVRTTSAIPAPAFCSAAQYSSESAPPARRHPPRRQFFPARPSPSYQTPNVRPHAHRPRIPNHRLPRRSARNIFSRHQFLPVEFRPNIRFIFVSRFSIRRHSTDQIARAIPPAPSDTNRRACQTRDNESAPRNRKQNRATRAEPRSTPPPALSTRRPAAEKYARTHPTAPATSPSRVSTTTLSGNPARRSAATRA